MATNTNKGLLTVIIVLIIGVLVWSVMTMPDQRSTGTKIGDAVDALPDGVDKAARQLEDRTPGEKVGDAVKDAGDEIKDATNSEQ